MRAGTGVRLLLGLIAAWLCVSARAQGLDDPTRPPAGWRAAGGAGGRAPGDAEGLVLESVIISEVNRSAIISGEHVMLGGKVGTSRLIKIAEAEVVLLSGNARRTLRLFPAGYKHDSEGSSSASAAR
jgi:hypothetical protein